jgi:hypothetical protein
MSKIPYRFHTPIPAIFYQNGILDSSKKIYRNRLFFLTWAFSQCYCIATIRDNIPYNSYEFSFSRNSGAKECGLTEDEFRTQKEFFENEGYLEKSNDTIGNRINRYRWRVERFTEDKIIEIEKIPNQNLGISREENQFSKEQNPQPNQEIPSKIPNQITDVLREEIAKNPQQNPQPNPHFSRTKEQKKVCLKETNINKEKCEAEPESKESLFLSHKEKNLFLDARKDLLSEQVEGLQIYLDYRNVQGITDKTLARWLRDYSFEDVKDSIVLMLDPENKKPDNPGGWIQRALENGWARKERIKRENRERAIQFKSKNNLRFLKINQRYCVDLRNKDKEFYYHIDPQIFETQLRNCL